MYTKLQFILFTLIETQTLKQVVEQYFEGEGIGYYKRVMAGKAKPHPLMIEGMLKKIPKELHEAYDKYAEYENSFKGW